MNTTWHNCKSFSASEFTVSSVCFQNPEIYFHIFSVFWIEFGFVLLDMGVSKRFGSMELRGQMRRTCLMPLKTGLAW